MINDIRPSRAYNYSAGPVRPDHALLPASYIVSQTFKLRMHGKLHTVANQAYERWRKDLLSPRPVYPT
ncbi:uncharacterized protein DFL_000250 [Arthrobotrys flagrans]|uniref:Uncharacterized protein n=1 Tax=Arthrobotrys flagrans TaxID=97331 RepID=A0A437ADE2_ARTFL|nr:hypothetical protein DFL_000250 [Arthrobotrys flagrans]